MGGDLVSGPVGGPVFTPEILAVSEHPEAWPWLALLFGVGVVVGAVFTYVAVLLEHDLEPADYCAMRMPHGDDVASCGRLAGHDGLHRDPYFEVSWEAVTIRCFECPTGTYRLGVLDVAHCSECGHAINVHDDLALLDGEHLIGHLGWVVVAISVATEIA